MLMDAGFSLAAWKVERFDDGENVLLDSEFSKDGRLLWQVANSEAGALVHALFGRIAAVDEHLTFRRGHQADDHVEGSGFSRAVRAEKTDDFAGGDTDI